VQPKSNLSAGFDPVGERLQPALRAGATGTEEGMDPGASEMSVVADADAPLDEQMGTRDATGYESGEVPMATGNRGNVPLPRERTPTPDDTRGHRPTGTAEMGHSPNRPRGRK
jgi:hypothetical protein